MDPPNTSSQEPKELWHPLLTNLEHMCNVITAELTMVLGAHEQSVLYVWCVLYMLLARLSEV